MKLKVLIIDDDEVTRKLLKEILDKEGYVICLASSGEEAIRLIKREVFPIILSDIRMLELDGMAVLRAVKKSGARSAVILMTGFGSMEGAVEAIRDGAFDYVSKPFKIDALKAVVTRAAKHWELVHNQRSNVASGRIEVKFSGLTGKSQRIVDVYKTLARAAMSASNVLVTGERGTGKDLVARAIHGNSSRRSKHFVTVNCGAIAENLLESELFGQVKGAFSGVAAEKRGFFEEADGGTIFLDEVENVPAALQVKLVRVFQDGEIKPLGSSQSKKIDVRIIAAAHQDLDLFVKAGKFREDLYYKLKVIMIDLPPLRERIDDLPDLVGHFLAIYGEKNKKMVSHVSEEAMKILSKYHWPGNIRELEHAIEHAVAMTSTTVLFPEDFPMEITRAQDNDWRSDNHMARLSRPEPVSDTLDNMERAHIIKVLQDVNFNKSKASEILGIDRATLYRKAQRYGIDMSGK
ncbi:MAG: sigma-54 dependent transcriptional regulator [Bdellovibrionota bacterium]